MKERWTNHIADFDTIELLAVDTETLDMDTDTLFTQSAEKYTLDIFSVCGKVGKEYVYGAFPKEMFLDFYKRNMWKRWIMHNAGYDLKVVRKLGLAWDQIKIEDTMVMAQLLGYTKWGYGLKDLRVSELGLEKRKGYEDIDRNNKKEYYTYAALDTLDTYKLYEKLLVRLEEEELLEAYAIERDVVYVVSDMEYTGVRINVELMAQTKPYLQKLLVPIEEKLNALTNYLDFNSPKKLQKFLFIDKGVEPQPGWLTAGGIKKKKLRLKKDRTPEEEMNYQAGKYDETVYDFSVGVDTLSELMLRDDDVAEISELILEHRKYSKLISTFIDGFIPKLEKGRIHGRILPFGTDSGRFCIGKGTKISMPGEEKNIEDVAIGDYVYCYDDEGNLAIRKVINKWNTGVKKVCKSFYRSKGNHKIISLISTYDHKIRKADLSYEEVQNLEKGSRVLHLTKGNAHGGRIRLYATNTEQVLEEVFIKKNYFKAKGEMHIHHIDECKSNNKISNLVVLSPNEHLSLHAKLNVSRGLNRSDHLKHYRPTPRYLKDNCNRIDKSKEELESMLREAKGRPTKVNMDFKTYKRKCKLAGVDIKSISKEYSKTGILLSEENVFNAVNTYGANWSKVGKVLGVNYYRAKELAIGYNISVNHTFIGLEDAGEIECWDIEVEDFHNFIANEVCVHNSSKNPNLQNIAAKDFDKEGGSIRAFFIPSKGRKFITADYSQIELKMAGMTSQDPVIVSAYQRGEDMHTITAKEFGIERKPSKTVNFGILYGMQAPTLQKAIKKAQKGDKKDGVDAVGFSLQECEVFIEKYWKTYLKVKGMFDYCTEQIKKVGYIRTISGRKRRCYDISDGILKGLLNTVIQGSAGELMKVALVRLWKNMDRNRAAIVLTVHDELTVEADEDYVEECSKIVTWAMEDIIKNFKFKFTTEMNTGYSWAESK